MLSASAAGSRRTRIEYAQRATTMLLRVASQLQLATAGAACLSPAFFVSGAQQVSCSAHFEFWGWGPKKDLTLAGFPPPAQAQSSRSVTYIPGLADLRKHTVTVVPGDGIGLEVTKAVTDVVEAVRAPIVWERWVQAPTPDAEGCAHPACNLHHLQLLSCVGEACLMDAHLTCMSTRFDGFTGTLPGGKAATEVPKTVLDSIRKNGVCLKGVGGGRGS